MKNLVNSGAITSLVERIERLHAGTKPLWGCMTSTEMLLHCNKVCSYLLTPPPAGQKKTSPKEYMIRVFALYLKSNFPKGIKGPKQVQTKGLVADEEFEMQKNAFIDVLRRFPELDSPINHRHPYFGLMNTKEWGITAWKHTDHHLRQFGV
jgi:hypothetical protein